MTNKRRPPRAPSKATPARRAALESLLAVREREVYLSHLFPRIFAEHDLDPSDRAFAYLLAQGALSLRATLDTLIDRSLRSPRDVKADVRDALRISAYEILYLHKEAHAAVDQGVELVRLIAPRATGVANYVLHRIVEEKDRFPYGDPRTSLEVAALFYGFPLWLARAIKKDIGTRNAHLVMEGSLEAAPIWFCANALMLDPTRLAGLLEDAGIEFSTGISLIARGARASSAAPIFRLAHRSDVGCEAFEALLATDEIIVSDLSAQSIVGRAVEALPCTGARMLEIGAGRGTKTLLFQSALANAGVELAAYEALDISEAKIDGLKERVEKAGGMLSSAFAHDATKPLPSQADEFDLVFIDAPCTGVGTLRRHPEIKSRLREGDSRDLAEIGQAILLEAAPAVKSGGYLMYATCTLFKEENEKVVKRFLASPAGADFQIVAIGAHDTDFFKTPIEANGPDLHFAALLQKLSVREPKRFAA